MMLLFWEIVERGAAGDQVACCVGVARMYFHNGTSVTTLFFYSMLLIEVLH